MDIILKDANGVDQTYLGVDTLQVTKADGKTGYFDERFAEFDGDWQDKLGDIVDTYEISSIRFTNDENYIENLELLNVDCGKHIYTYYDESNNNLVFYSQCKISAPRNSHSIFADLNSVEHIYFDSFDTSNVTSMSHMFNKCSSLTSLDLSSFDTSNVTDMGYMFRGCSLLQSLDLSSFNTNNVTIMYYMFYNCSSLVNINFGENFNTSNVTQVERMFYDCSSLTSLNLINWNTGNMTGMYYMFSGCSSLTSLDLSDFDTSNVTEMGGMFYGCSSLQSLDLSNFDTSDVTGMGVMFKGCTSLTSLNLSNFNRFTNIGNDAPFTKLTSLIFNPNAITSYESIINITTSPMSKTALINMFNSLPNVDEYGFINIADCIGTPELTQEDLNIAINKGWEVKTTIITDLYLIGDFNDYSYSPDYILTKESDTLFKIENVELQSGQYFYIGSDLEQYDSESATIVSENDDITPEWGFGVFVVNIGGTYNLELDTENAIITATKII